MAYIEMVHSFKRYHMGSTTIAVNNDVNFSIEQGELAIILGASGTGKSTVLNILGGMDTNSEGQVIINGKDISNYTAHQLTDYRRTDISFVFQFHNLVANLTAKENVELASEIVKDAQNPPQALIDVGLQDRINNFPAQLSGGEGALFGNDLVSMLIDGLDSHCCSFQRLFVCDYRAQTAAAKVSESDYQAHCCY